MASIKLKFRPSKNEKKEGTLYIQLIHSRKIKRITCRYRIYNEEWDYKNGQIKHLIPSKSRQETVCAIRTNIQWEINKIKGIMSDGYNPLLDNAKNMTKARYSGRLLMLSIHIIENKISQQRAQELLRGQIPLSNIIQEAYNIANDIERDVIRKLLYLTLTKAMNIGSDNDSLLGRLEAIARIAKNIYSLLDGVNMSE